MRGTIGKLRAVLRLDGTQFDRDVRRQRSRLAGIMGFARRVFAPLAAAAATIGSVQAVRRTLDLVDAQAKLARSLGTTIESMQVLSRASELAGINQSQMEASSRDLTRRLSQAAGGAGPAADALDRLGLSAAGLLELPLDQRILAINTALGEHVTAAERAAVAGALFGEEGALVMTRLDPATLRQANEEIAQFGRVVSDVEAGAIEQANDAISLMGLSLRSLVTDATIALAPVIERVSRAMAVTVRQLQPVLAGMRDWVEIGAAFARWVYRGATSLQTYASIFETVRSAVGSVFAALGRLGAGLSALIEQTGGFAVVWDHLKAIAAEALDRIVAAMRVMGLRAKAVFQDMAGGLTTRLGEMIGSAAQWAARMTDIAIGAKDAMLAAFGALPDALGSLMFQAANAAIGGVESLINGVITRVNTFLGRINGAIQSLPEWARGDFNGITPLDPVTLNGIPDPFEDAQGLGSAASDAFTAAQGQSDFGALGGDLRARGATLSGRSDGSRLAADVVSALNSGALSSVEGLTTALDNARAAAEEADAATEDLGSDLDDLGESADSAAESLAGGGAGGGAGSSVAEAASEAADQVQTLQGRVNSLAQGLAQALFQGQRFGDVVTNALQRVGEAWATQGIETILGRVVGLSGGGGGNFLGGLLSNIFPGRALGGGVRGGQIYQVNENTARSEWMFASGNGGVLNHGQMQAAVGRAVRSGGDAPQGRVRLELSEGLEARLMDGAAQQSVEITRAGIQANNAGMTQQQRRG